MQCAPLLHPTIAAKPCFDTLGTGVARGPPRSPGRITGTGRSGSTRGGGHPPAVRARKGACRPRPAPEGGCHQVLPVDWKAVVENADTATNYQILPGDRVYVAAYPLTKVDITLARMIAPIERVFGIILLGTSMTNNIRFPPNQFNNNNNNNVFP